MVDSGELDDLVIKVLGHRERKRILKIVGSYSEGINYTGVLGETGLSTGRLNYHLGELEGFLDRDEDRLYRLSPLGTKAVATLEFIKQDIDPSIFETVNTKRAARLKKIQGRYDFGFYFITLIMVGINILIGYAAYVESDPLLAIFGGFWVIFSAGIIYMTNKSRKNEPEKVLWIWEWLEWKLFKGYEER